MPLVERLVWSRLRERQIGGFKFRRQVPIGPYFADFACLSERLVVEIDGPHHEDDPDNRKDAYLRDEGYRVMRVSVADVDEYLDDVVHGIFCELETPYSVLDR